MSKLQVIGMSLLVAVPALGLLTVMVFAGMENGGRMFSGAMTVFVSVTSVLALVLGLSPFAILAFYPKDGFGLGMADVDGESAAPAAAPRPQPAHDDEFEADDEFESDGFDEGGDFEDDGGFDDAYAEDDSFEDEFEDFDDEEEWS